HRAPGPLAISTKKAPFAPLNWLSVQVASLSTNVFAPTDSALPWYSTARVMLKPRNEKAGLPDPPFPAPFKVMNPTGSVVAVVWAKMLAADVSRIPTARRRDFGAEGFMVLRLEFARNSSKGKAFTQVRSSRVSEMRFIHPKQRF